MSSEPVRKRERRHWHEGPEGAQTGPANLDELPLGSAGTVMAITGERKLRRRLMEMGLLEGSRLRVVKFAPTGDPIQIQVNDYYLSLRRNEASHIVVSVEGSES